MSIFIIFFDIGWIFFFFFMMIAGATIAMGEAATAASGYMVGHMTMCCLGFFAFVLVMSIAEYIGIFKAGGLKTGIFHFSFWNIGNILVSIPLITLVYISIIPQALTSLGNMIICGIFFFFVILGMIYVYTKAMSVIVDDGIEENGGGAMFYLYGTAVLGLVVVYFLNRFVVAATEPSIYIKLYGDQLGGLILSVFSKAK